MFKIYDIIKVLSYFTPTHIFLNRNRAIPNRNLVTAYQHPGNIVIGSGISWRSVGRKFVSRSKWFLKNISKNHFNSTIIRIFCNYFIIKLLIMISDIGKSCTFDFIEHRYGTWPAVWWPSTKRKCHLQFCFYHHFGKPVETIPQYKESGIFTWIFQESLDTPPPHSPLYIVPRIANHS